MQGNNINLDNLTFTPQPITQQTQTTHISFTEGSDTVYIVGKTVQGILKIEAGEQSIVKNISMTASGIYKNGEESVQIKSNSDNGIKAVSIPEEWDREVIITNERQTAYQNGTLYGYVNITLTNDKTYTARVGIDASKAISSPSISSLTFTPQQITQSQTIDIQFTESSKTVYIVGKTVQGILKIEAGGQSITKNISMSAATVYENGAKSESSKPFTYKALAKNPSNPYPYMSITDVWVNQNDLRGIVKITHGSASQSYDVKMPIPSTYGGISISDVIIRAANPAAYSTSADKNVSLEYDFVNYDSDNDVIKGKVNISLGTATGTTTTQSLFITMDASKKSSSGSSSGGITINDVSISKAVGVAYLITPIEKSVSISQENINYKNGQLTGGVTITLSDGTNTINKNILVKMTAGSGVSSSSSWTENILQPDESVIYEGDKYLTFDSNYTVYDSNQDRFESRVRINHSNYSQTYVIRVDASQKTSGSSSSGTTYRVVNGSAYVANSSYTKLNLEYNAGNDQEITLPRVWNSYTQEYDSAYGLGYSTGYNAASGSGGGYTLDDINNARVQGQREMYRYYTMDLIWNYNGYITQITAYDVDGNFVKTFNAREGDTFR